VCGISNKRNSYVPRVSKILSVLKVEYQCDEKMGCIEQYFKIDNSNEEFLKSVKKPKIAFSTKDFLPFCLNVS
jgi:hypothetical protein